MNDDRQGPPVMDLDEGARPGRGRARTLAVAAFAAAVGLAAVAGAVVASRPDGGGDERSVVTDERAVPGRPPESVLAEGESTGGARWALSVSPTTEGSELHFDVRQSSPAGEPWGGGRHAASLGDPGTVVDRPRGEDLPGPDGVLLFGRVRGDVRTVRLEPRGGEPVEVAATPAEGLTGRYYGAVVRGDGVDVDLVALDAGGRELGRATMPLPPAMPDRWCHDLSFACPE